MSVILHPDFPHTPTRIPIASGANAADVKRTRERIELAKGLFASLVKAHVENLAHNITGNRSRDLQRELRLFLDGLDDIHHDLAGSIHDGLVEDV